MRTVPAFDALFREAAVAALPALAGQVWLPLSGGRTNRSWRVGDAVVKRYDDGAASPLFPNDRLAEVRALTLAAPRGLAPELLAQGGDWIAYRHLPGPSWPGGDPRPVARLLHAVHQLTAADFRHLPSGSAGLMAQAQAIVAQCRGALPPVPPHRVVDPAPARLIHGDAVPGNIIGAVGPLCLIDWQCPAIGDPAEDLAAFLSPAMQWLYRGGVLPDDAAAAFLDAYPDPEVAARYRALRPLFNWRMAAHCLWRAERGAADYATALSLELQALAIA